MATFETTDRPRSFDDPVYSARKPARFVSLWLRFALLVLTFTFMVAFLVGLLLVNLASRLVAAQKHDQAKQTCMVLSRCGAELIADGDLAGLALLADQTAQDADVVYVQFTSPDGEVLATAGSVAESTWTKEDPTDISQSGISYDLPRSRIIWTDSEIPTHVAVTCPMMAAVAGLEVAVASGEPGTGNRQERHDGIPTYIGPRRHEMEAPASQLMGYASIGLNVSGVLGDLGAAFDLFSGITTLMLLLAVPGAIGVVRYVAVPVRELFQVVQRFAHGDQYARSTIRRNDEIGELATAFNGMADDIVRKHNEIVALNMDLEHRVQERTEQLKELASREPLTGLYNRRHFSEVLERRFSEATRYGGQLSCMLIDVDEFKSVNDEFGHHQGDELLILLAITITSQLRAADVAARFGGDEFVVLLPQTDLEHSLILGRRIREKFEADAAEQFPHLSVGLSIGVASVGPAAFASGEDLVRAADKAMYRAKSQGKNRIEYTVGPA